MSDNFVTHPQKFQERLAREAISILRDDRIMEVFGQLSAFHSGRRILFNPFKLTLEDFIRSSKYVHSDDYLDTPETETEIRDDLISCPGGVEYDPQQDLDIGTKPYPILVAIIGIFTLILVNGRNLFLSYLNGKRVHGKSVISIDLFDMYRILDCMQAIDQDDSRCSVIMPTDSLELGNLLLDIIHQVIRIPNFISVDPFTHSCFEFTSTKYQSLLSHPKIWTSGISSLAYLQCNSLWKCPFVSDFRAISKFPHHFSLFRFSPSSKLRHHNQTGVFLSLSYQVTANYWLGSMFTDQELCETVHATGTSMPILHSYLAKLPNEILTQIIQEVAIDWNFAYESRQAIAAHKQQSDPERLLSHPVFYPTSTNPNVEVRLRNGFVDVFGLLVFSDTEPPPNGILNARSIVELRTAATDVARVGRPIDVKHMFWDKADQASRSKHNSSPIDSFPHNLRLLFRQH